MPEHTSASPSLPARRASQNEDVDEQGEREKRDYEREGAAQGGGRGSAAQGAARKRADGDSPAERDRQRPVRLSATSQVDTERR
jgi:hypothetical protein